MAKESRGGEYYDTIVKFDGITGQPSVVYTSPDDYSMLIQLVPHPDGTIFATTTENGWVDTVIGIDPSTGTQKFSVPVPRPSDAGECGGNMIIAGDGYAYLTFGWTSDPDLAPSYTTSGYCASTVQARPM